MPPLVDRTAARPRARRAAALLGLAALLAAPAAGAAAATGPLPPAQAPAPEQERALVTFGVSPASATAPDERPFLSYGLAPGAEVFDHVAVLNQSDEPLTLLVYAGDGLNSEGGGLDITERADRNTDLGAWVTLGPDSRTGRLDPDSRSLVSVTVPPQDARTGRGTVIVPFRLAVPRDASPGDHVGGIAVALVTRGDNAQSQNVELEQRVVARLYARVAGPLRPGLDVDVLDAGYVGGAGLGLSGAVRLTYRVTNTGNTRIGASAVARAQGLLGLGASTAEAQVVPELVPGGSAVLETTVTGIPPTVVAEAGVAVEGVAAPGTEPSGDLPSDRDVVRGWAVTWQQGAVAGLLVLLALALLLRRRRRGQQPPRVRHGRSGGPQGGGDQVEQPVALARGTS